jgi:hypothetical protein
MEEHESVGQEESDLMRRRLLQEDAWMQSQGPTSEFRLNLNQNNPLLRFNAELFPSRVGSDRDFLWGKIVIVVVVVVVVANVAHYTFLR